MHKSRGGATPPGRYIKGFGGIFWEKIISASDVSRESGVRFCVILNLIQDLKNNVKPLSRHTCHPHLTHSTHVKKAAFTLAEVLITLGIIGIVSAMTIPALVQDYREKADVIRLKKAVAALEQAKLMAINDGLFLKLTYLQAGGVYIQEEHEKFANYFKPYFKVAIDCALPDVSNTACIGDYDNAKIYKIDKFSQATSLAQNTFRGFITNDGISYFFYAMNGTILIDLNTPKNGPNAYGHDIFKFNIDSTGRLVVYGNIETLEECKITGSTCSNWVMKYGNKAYINCPDKVEYGGNIACR